MSRITLLTDFGTRDGFIGAVKGAIQTVFPGAVMDDVAHDLPRGDIESGARALQRYWRRWPAGTVHYAVVDPGVGSARRAIAVEAERRFLVAPDNGILSPVFETAVGWRAVEIRTPRFLAPDPSRTFHGRDIFAPAAAWLARGIHRSRLGPKVEDPVRLALPEPRLESGKPAEGEVIGSDRFGNLITNLPASALAESVAVEVEGVRIPVASTYADVEPGEPLALEDSEGRLEVAARDASAEKVLDVGAGARVRVLPA